jgi:hypothetical protein
MGDAVSIADRAGTGEQGTQVGLWILFIGGL